jgi:CubicO group peptidase (beta-lactamase class C family)
VTTAAIDIHGTCDPAFGAVKDAFAENFGRHGEVGASLALVADGKLVVDLWGGYADPGRTRPWERDTIVNVYSTTKGITTICAHRLVDEGKLDVDAPVAKYWPEFAQAGKEKIPVRFLLSHRAGLPAFREFLPAGSAGKWEFLTEKLAATEPWWEPGTQHGYHAVTFGYLVGEVIRRITGMSVGTYFRKELAEPLGLDFHIGLAEEHDPRVAHIIPAPVTMPDPSTPMGAAFLNPNSMNFRAFMMSPEALQPGFVNTREWRAAEIPAANGHGDARSLARLYGALATDGKLDGQRVLSKEAIAAATTEQAYGPDAIIMLPMRYGLGFMLDYPESEMRLSPTGSIFGHAGMGGSFAYADPKAGIGMGYAMNAMKTSYTEIDPRWVGMLGAIYGSL